MPKYFKAEIQVVPGKTEKLLEVLKSDVFPTMERQGWKLLGCFAHQSGSIYMITDLWEIDDLNHLDTGRKGLAAHPELPRILAVLSECTRDETLTLLDRLV